MSKKEKKIETSKKESIKKEKSEKKNVFEIIGNYFRGVGKEAKRIRWTDGKDLIKYSIATVTFVVFFGLYFYLIEMIAAFVRSGM